MHLPFLFAVLLAGSQPDTARTYIVTVEAHGLMCPFLGPMAVERLQKWEPLGCVRDAQASTIRITLRPDDDHTLQDIRTVLVGVGYEQEKIHIALADE
jgi:hypothetical protein